MKTVLIVDDSPMIRELLRGVLEPEGYAILEAGDGEEAMRLYRKHHVDLSVIDIFLPKKGGLQVMGEMVRSGSRPTIIAISGGEAFNPDSIVELAKIFEVAATFTKPINTGAFLAKVKVLLGE